jgi:filamentous hemagglutinin
MSFRNPVTTLPASAITGSLPADQVGTGNFTGTYNIVGAFTTGGTGARVDINPNGIFAYNAVGGQTVNISALNGSVSISGTFTIATAVSGTRMVIDNTGINAFNGATNTFNLDATTGNVSIVGTFSTGVSGARVTMNGSQILVYNPAGNFAFLSSTTGPPPSLTIGSPTDATNNVSAQLFITGGTSVGNAKISTSNTFNVSGTFNALAASSFSGAVSLLGVGAPLSCGGTATVSGLLTANGGLTASAGITVSGGGIAVTGGATIDTLTVTNHVTMPDFASGQLTTSATANVTVTFPASRFTATPRVVAGARQNTFVAALPRSVFVGNETATNFTIFCSSGTAGVAIACAWIAINY